MWNETLESQSTIPSFWDTLQMFWGQDRTRNWHDAVFSTPSRTEVVENLIVLRRDLHAVWGSGWMAIKPIDWSPTVLKLEVHWIRNRRPASKTSSRPPPVDLLQVPSLVIPSNEEDGFDYRDVTTKKQTVSGDVVTMTTDDPVTRPLPSWDLLQMQWVLQRLSAISGAADPQDNWSDDDSSDWSDGEAIEEDGGVERAVETGNL
jgi:hypothetical protein